MVPMMTVMPTPGKVPRRMTDPDVITVDHGRESCHGARGARQHGIARESARLQTGRGTSPSALAESKHSLCGSVENKLLPGCDDDERFALGFAEFGLA